MPIPETPYTREEAYLNAIATGDSSGIPETPYTREEMYLDAIARNGGGGGGGSSTLSGLTDVDISNPTDGQTLVYNASAGKWENGAGGGGVLVVHDVNGTLDKTWQEIVNALHTQEVLMFATTEYDGATVTAIGRVYNYEENPDMPIYVLSFESTGDYLADTPNGYPSKES